MIVYAVICGASDATVLAEHSSDSLMSGNAPQVTIALLQHLKNNPEIVKDSELKTFVHDNDDEDDSSCHPDSDSDDDDEEEDEDDDGDGFELNKCNFFLRNISHISLVSDCLFKGRPR